MAEKVYLAVDLGASSGRVLAGRFDGSRLTLEEVTRFDNGGVALGSRLYWDFLGLWSHVCRGLRAAGSKFGRQVRSLGVDTWGVDFGLLGRGDELLANPRHYRDHHTDGILERAFGIVPREEIFAETGLQFMQFNSLYQLLALRLAESAPLAAAERLLMMPDLFHWLLTGVAANEFTNASTTQFLNPATRQWSRSLLERFGLPTNILGDLVEPGTRLGRLLPQIADETGLSGVDVVLPGTHDTASAVVAVPAEYVPLMVSGTDRPASGGREPPGHVAVHSAPLTNWCYISSGTWSLMGVESPAPVVTDLCRQLNFTNEGGVGGTTRLLKNISGLWLLQECRRVWAQQGRAYDWEELNRLSDAAPPLAALIDPDDPSFMAPADMPEAIRAFCRRTGQQPPADDGAVIRCALEALALKYRQVLGWLEQLTGGRLETIHIVGGGSLNRRLCQAAADACGRRVVAGPVEATAIGNAMMQAVADGAVADVAQARAVIRGSFRVEEYHPRDTAAWDEAYGRFVKLV